MIFKPPYWHHDNIKFSDDDLEILKYEIDGLREKKFAKEKQHISTFFLEKYERPEKKYLNLYKKIVADITKSVSWNKAKTAPAENCHFLNLIKIQTKIAIRANIPELIDEF